MNHQYIAYSDQQLLERIRNDDVHAFDILFKKYWHVSYNSAYKSLKDPDKCKTIVHDIFLKIWERRHKLEIGNPEAYIKAAVRFRVISCLKRQKEIPFFELFDSIAVSTYSPENHFLEKETILLIESWIKILPLRRREIFIRHFFGQLSTGEIAEEMNISQKTVQNQIVTSFRYLYSRFGHLIYLLLYCNLF